MVVVVVVVVGGGDSSGDGLECLCEVFSGSSFHFMCVCGGGG